MSAKLRTASAVASMWRGRLRLAAGAACAISTTVPLSGRTETLAEAIALAYDANPTLQSQRAQLRALDEDYVQAQSGWRPTLSAGANLGHTRTPGQGIFGGRSETISDTGDLALNATQPLYTGGRTEAQVRGADAQIRAGREQLRATEAQILFNVVQAYWDVLRDRSILQIQRGGLGALQDTYDEIKARYEAGANTRTDVAQAGAQIEVSRALVNSAETQLGVSNAEYVGVIGQSPGTLTPPEKLADVPIDIDEAFRIAEDENATLRQAEYTETADRAQIMQARAAERPTVTFTGSVGETSLETPFDHHAYDQAASVSLAYSQPLFSGGVIQSQIRQAIEQDTSARLQVEAARRTVVQNVAQAFSQNRGAQENIRVDTAQVQVAQAAYDGMRVEYRAGLRSTLDVLVAEQTLTQAQVSLAQAQHDAYVTDAGLLSAVGRLEARVVVQGVPLYQPQRAFRRVEDRGAVPWQGVPALLDKIGSPGLDQPREIRTPDAAPGPIRLTPSSSSGPLSTQPSYAKDAPG